MTITTQFDVGQEVWEVFFVPPLHWDYAKSKIISIDTHTESSTSIRYTVAGCRGLRDVLESNLFPTRAAAEAEIQRRKNAVQRP